MTQCILILAAIAIVAIVAYSTLDTTIVTLVNNVGHVGSLSRGCDWKRGKDLCQCEPAKYDRAHVKSFKIAAEASVALVGGLLRTGRIKNGRD